MKKKEIIKLMDRLKKDYYSKKFKIQKESDIICYLYYLLKKRHPNNNRIFTEFKTNELLWSPSGKSKRRGRFDIVILKDKIDDTYQTNIIDTAFEIKYDHDKNYSNLGDFKDIFWEDERKLTCPKNNVKNKIIMIFNHEQFSNMNKFKKFYKRLEKEGIIFYYFFDV